MAHLKEPLQPPHLEYTLSEQNKYLKDAPPFDAAVGAFCRVPVGAFPDNDIALLVLDL